MLGKSNFLTFVVKMETWATLNPFSVFILHAMAVYRLEIFVNCHCLNQFVSLLLHPASEVGVIVLASSVCQSVCPSHSHGWTSWGRATRRGVFVAGVFSKRMRFFLYIKSWETLCQASCPPRTVCVKTNGLRIKNMWKCLINPNSNFKMFTINGMSKTD